MTARFPLGLFVAVTGVSGSGKSTLVQETLFPVLMHHTYGSHAVWGAHEAVNGLELIDKVIDIDQSPIGKTPRSNPATYPYGIYTIPEISFVGKTEEKLTEEDVPYEVGVSYYRETARGQIRGDTTGRLKLIFHRETREILGVHIIGEGASELIHIGQAVIVLKGTVDYFVETVFNYPTLAECYKQAAFNGRWVSA